MAEPKAPSPWLFALTQMPYGVVGSFSGPVMAYLTRRAGIDVGDIGWFVTLLLLPPMLQFLYAPVVDFGPRRKYWLLIVTVIGAGFLVGACVTPLPEHTTLFLAFAFAAQTVSGLVGTCNGGLMATMIPDHLRGRASAWLTVGNLCGGGISAAIATYMTGHGFDPLLIGGVIAAMMIVPALAVLAIDEPMREAAGTVREVLASTLRDVKVVLLSRAGITGILLCLSPVGTAALSSYFGGIAVDYGKSGVLDELSKISSFDGLFDLFQLPVEQTALDERASDLVAFSAGPLGQILTAFGALVGGFLCDRTNRRAMYLLSGALTAVCGIVMALSTRDATTFIVGSLAYALITGFCFSAFFATVLETIGTGKAAATKYSLYLAAGNAAIAYVGLIDSRFHEEHGVEGVVASDAALNLGGVIVLGTVFWLLGSFGKSHHKPVPEGPTG